MFPRRTFLKAVLATATTAALAALAGPGVLAAAPEGAIPFRVVRRLLLLDRADPDDAAWLKAKRLARSYGARLLDAGALVQRLDTHEYGVFVFPDVHAAVVAAMLVDDSPSPPPDSDALELRIWAVRHELALAAQYWIDPARVPDWYPTEKDAVASVGGATWDFHGTVTGRMASSRPNISNIPVHTGEGQRIRKAFLKGLV